MPRNGSGSYSLPESPFVYDTVISETAMNSDLSDIASALTASLAKDGQTTPTANLPMGSYKHTGANTGSGANSGEYVVRDYYNSLRYLNNVLINPDGYINQMGTTSTADDTYGGPDGWYTLVQTGAVSVAQGTNLADGTPFYERVTQSQASAQRMGRAQIIESANCRHMRGQSITLQLLLGLSTSANMRYMIGEWTGTADAVTSDFVNDWTSGTYTGGNFFISSNFNVLAVGVTALTGGTPATVSLAATVGSSMNNLVVFYWTEGTAAQNVTMDRTKAKLALGTVATPYYPRPGVQELALCQRYLYQYTNSTGSQSFTPSSGYNSSTTNSRQVFVFPVQMRSTPTLSVSNVANFDVASNAEVATTNVSTSLASTYSATLNLTVASGLTAGGGAIMFADNGEYLRFDARL